MGFLADSYNKVKKKWNDDSSLLGIAKNTVTGLGSAGKQVLTKGPGQALSDSYKTIQNNVGLGTAIRFPEELAKTMYSGTKDFVQTSGKVFGEGLAYGLDKNVRDQYKAGNTEILPTISSVSPLQMMGKTVRAMSEVWAPKGAMNLARARAVANPTRINKAIDLGTRVLKGAAPGYAYDVSNRVSDGADIKEKGTWKPGMGTGIGALFGAGMKPTAQLSREQAQRVVDGAKEQGKIWSQFPEAARNSFNNRFGVPKTETIPAHYVPTDETAPFNLRTMRAETKPGYRQSGVNYGGPNGDRVAPVEKLLPEQKITRPAVPTLSQILQQSGEALPRPGMSIQDVSQKGLTVGSRVKSSDRGNVGTIVHIDENGVPLVNFRNKENKTNASVRIPSEKLTLIGGNRSSKVPTIDEFIATRGNNRNGRNSSALSQKNQEKTGSLETIGQSGMMPNKTQQPVLPSQSQGQEVPAKNTNHPSGSFGEVPSYTGNVSNVPRDVQGAISGQPVRERGFVSTVKSGEKTPGQVKDSIYGDYVVKSDSQRLGDARRLIIENPQEAEKRALNPTNDDDITVGNQLLDHYIATGQFDKVEQMTSAMAPVGTELGRAVRAFGDYDKTSPSGAVKFAQKTISKYNREHPENPLKLSNEQIQNFVDRATEIQKMPAGRERSIASDKLMKEVNNLIPSTLASKVMTVWKAGLLTSLRTTARNLIGNTIHAVTEVAKDIPAVVADKLMSLKTRKRSLTLTTRGIISGSKEGFRASWDVMRHGFDPEEAINKYDVGHITWNDNPIEQAAKVYTDAVFRTLGAQDKPFYHVAFARSLYDQAGAEAINAGMQGNRAFIENLVKNPTEAMKTIATQDASIATFKNKNALAQVIVKAKQMAQKHGGQVGTVISELVAPFTGVPSSIAGQMIAYSPVGLTKGVYQTGKVLLGKGGNQRTAAQSFGRGAVGTALAAAGAYLTAQGLMTGNPKDQEEARLWQIQGKQPNSVLIGGKWRSINSIGPEMLMALAGSKVESSPDPMTAMSNVGKDFLNQTFLAGVQQPLQAISDPARYAGTYIPGQVASFIPNIVKDVAKSGDEFQRETFVPGDVMESTKNSVQASFPIVRNKLLPKRDVLGNPMLQEPTGIGAFIDVFNSKTPISNSVADELARLYSVDAGATPSKISNKQTIFGQKVNLTPEELDTLERQTGGMVQKSLEMLVNSDGYKALSDEEKQNLISNTVSTIRKSVKNNSVLNSGAATTSFDSNSVDKKNRLAMEKADFEQSPENLRDLGDTVLRKNPDGTSRVQRKAEYNLETANYEMTAAKDDDDAESWMASAEKKAASIKSLMLDPSVDQNEKMKYQHELDSLVKQYAKVQKLGDFTGARKAKGMTEYNRKADLDALKLKVMNQLSSNMKIGKGVPKTQTRSFGRGNTIVRRQKSLIRL